MGSHNSNSSTWDSPTFNPSTREQTQEGIWLGGESNLKWEDSGAQMQSEQAVWRCSLGVHRDSQRMKFWDAIWGFVEKKFTPLVWTLAEVPCLSSGWLQSLVTFTDVRIYSSIFCFSFIMFSICAYSHFSFICLTRNLSFLLDI